MSKCGGTLYGFYNKNVLIRIESKYSAELGYSSINVDFDKNQIKSIQYREYFAEWEKYSESYPNDKEIDPNKMTYSDTLYLLNFGDKNIFKVYAGKDLIRKKINEELLERLQKCIEIMKEELSSDKQLVKG